MTHEDDFPTIDGSTGPVAPQHGPGAPRVENYRILERIGEGGMGEVYAAEQMRPVRRRVALKLIKPGMDSREIVARFESERQALAMMDHPSIAKVLDAGTTAAGRPFFVMEYVNGVPITDHCDRHRLTNRDRLELFLKVCEGVQHAHQKAIIHRDLKPSNVLVSLQAGRAEPRIIDFGVAKALGQRLTAATMYTQLGQIVGTLEYMSPEQADLSAQDIDTRSDVYSLGVMLYELLVGQLPFDTAELRSLGFDEARRRIRDEEPRPPSHRLAAGDRRSVVAGEKRATDPGILVRQLRGDLDWITMRALEKDRTRRYGSVGDLAADIRRFLDDRPVLARPPSPAYRFGKLVRRHRAAVTAASIAVVALVAGLSLAAAGFVRASRERDQKNAALAEAESVTAFLTGMLAAADPARAGREVTVRQVLDRASAGIGERTSGRPLLEARLRRTIGLTYHSLGLLEEAENHLVPALELRRRTLPADDPLVLESVADLGELRYSQGHYEAAEELFSRLLDTRRVALGETDPDTDMARLLLGNVRFQQGRYPEATELHGRALEGLRRALGSDHPKTLLAEFNLASDFWASGQLGRAEPLYREVLAGRTRKLGPEHPETLDALNNLAALCHVDHRPEEAERLYRRALEIGGRVRGENHPETLVTLTNLGELLVDEGRAGEGLPLLERAASTQARVLGELHKSTLYTLSVLVRGYRAAGDVRRAKEVATRLYAARLDTLGPADPATIAARATLDSFVEDSGAARLQAGNNGSPGG